MPTAVEESKEDANEAKIDASEEPAAHAENEKKEKAESKSADPIRWFGILVPPALRLAQSHFISAVEGPVPQVANLARELRAMEIKIGRARKAIRKLDKV
jgi:hypothetical protein